MSYFSAIHYNITNEELDCGFYKLMGHQLQISKIFLCNGQREGVQRLNLHKNVNDFYALIIIKDTSAAI